MFGKNIPIKPVYEARTFLSVIGIFRTIQGEGPLAGEPAIFVRLAGCNLRCHFCDTEFTKGARDLLNERIVDEIEFLSGDAIGLVVLTGGEPLAQPVTQLIALLVQKNYHVQIETAGTVWQAGLDAFVLRGEVTIVCSPKTTSVHKMVEEFCEDFKYIIRDGETDPHDGLPSRSTQDSSKPVRIFRPPERAQVWVQPCDEYARLASEPVRDLVKVKRNVSHTVDVALEHGYRISFQLHKVLGVE